MIPTGQATSEIPINGTRARNMETRVRNMTNGTPASQKTRPHRQSLGNRNHKSTLEHRLDHHVDFVEE